MRSENQTKGKKERKTEKGVDDHTWKKKCVSRSASAVSVCVNVCVCAQREKYRQQRAREKSTASEGKVKTEKKLRERDRVKCGASRRLLETFSWPGCLS